MVRRKFDKLKSYYPLFVDALYAEVTRMEREVGALLATLKKSEG